MSRIWPGALCVLNHHAEPENQGACVRVLVRDPADDCWTFDDASRPIAMFRGAKLWGAIRATRDGPDNNSWIPGYTMTPLTPPPESESTLRELDAPVFG